MQADRPVAGSTSRRFCAFHLEYSEEFSSVLSHPLRVYKSSERGSSRESHQTTLHETLHRGTD